MAKFGALVLSATLPVLAQTPPALASPEAFRLRGYGTATINGVFTAGEWTTADSASFNAALPGGGTTAVTLYSMNDGTNLYLGLAIANWAPLANSSMAVIFDNNDNGVCDQGEDALLVNASNPAFLNDQFWTAGCVSGFSDQASGGTTDGSTAVLANVPASSWEMAHPLDDADSAHDFNLAVGAVFGFSLQVTLCGGACATTSFPASAWGFFGEIEVVPSNWVWSDGFESGDYLAWSSYPP